MLDFIAQLRRKPEQVRRHIAFFAAAGITLCILLVWLLSLTARTTTLSVSSSDSKKERTGPTLGASVGMIREALRSIKEQLSGTLSIYPAPSITEPKNDVMTHR